MDSNPMTAEGLAALRAEIDELEGPARREIARQIKTAREWGDLKENGEYHAAKEAQAHLETKIATLRARLLGAEVVEVAGGEVVAFGSRVELEDTESGKRLSYRIVSSREAAPADGRLSYESPVAAALLGLRAGDVARVETPRSTRDLRVLSVG